MNWKPDGSEKEAEDLLDLLTSGTVPSSQAGAALAALRMKGESMSELLGMAKLLVNATCAGGTGFLARIAAFQDYYFSGVLLVLSGSSMASIDRITLSAAARPLSRFFP